LIAADTKMAICQQANLLPIQIDGLVDSIQYDEIVAQTLHFGKFYFH